MRPLRSGTLPSLSQVWGGVQYRNQLHRPLHGVKPCTDACWVWGCVALESLGPHVGAALSGT